MAELSDIQLDALREMGNIGAGNAATALSQLISETVDISVPSVKVVPLENVSFVLGGPEKIVYVVYLEVQREMNGTMLTIFGPESADFLTKRLLQADKIDMQTDIAQSALTNSRWRFATNQMVLNRLASPPTGRWDAAYQLPSDMIMLSALTVNDLAIPYDLYGSKAYCNVSSNQSVIADYVFRADESTWPPYFTTAVEYMMASVLAVSVARDSTLAGLMEQKSDYLLRQARRLHSQQQTTRKLNTSRFIAERRS